MIVWEDSDFILAHKPSGVPTTPAQNGVKSLEEIFAPAHAVHRLDQRVSGLVLLAKNAQAMAQATRLFQDGKVEKTYLAMVNQLPEQPSPLLHWIKQEKNKAKISHTPQAGYQPAELDYSVLASSTRYHLLRIQLKTGRFHQIRAQLSAVHSPIVGDIKYGFKRTTPEGSIFLQASKLAWIHPFSGESMHFTLPLPETWARYGFTNPHIPLA